MLSIDSNVRVFAVIEISCGYIQNSSLGVDEEAVLVFPDLEPS
jgi:hypothetical protein